MVVEGVTAEEAMSVFVDFDRHKEFIPDVIKSTVARYERCAWDVDYEVDVPLLKNEWYSVKNALNYAEGSYSLAWNKIDAYTTKEIEGGIQFISTELGTVMVYVNFIVPGRSLSGLMERRAKKATVDVAKAVVDEVKRLKAKELATLGGLVDTMRARLAE